MVRLVDLDDDGCEKETPARYTPGEKERVVVEVDDRPNPNYDLGFAQALSCYP